MASAKRGKDWRPKPRSIKDVIAADVWTWRERGRQRKARIVVGVPQALPERDYYVPVFISAYGSRIRPIYGVGPVDALMNAMTLVKTFFDQTIGKTPHSTDPDRDMPDLSWLQNWCKRYRPIPDRVTLTYAHDGGWRLSVNLAGTPLARRKPPRPIRSGSRAANSYIHSEVIDGRYIVEGDVGKLFALVGSFRFWATHPGFQRRKR